MDPQPAGPPCRFWICQLPILHEPISKNESLSMCFYILLVLFLWRTLTIQQALGSPCMALNPVLVISLCDNISDFSEPNLPHLQTENNDILHFYCSCDD